MGIKKLFLCNLQLMSDNTDFTVVGVLGPSGVGKSTILNELYGFDSNSPGDFDLKTSIACYFPSYDVQLVFGPPKLPGISHFWCPYCFCIHLAFMFAYLSLVISFF